MNYTYLAIYEKFFLLSMIVIMSACNALEEEPVGPLSPEGLFQTEEDVALSVNGGYSLLAHEAFWGRKLPLTLLLRGDMAAIGDESTFARRIGVDRMDMSANNGMIEAIWPQGYQSIAALNEAINGSKNVPQSDELNATIAEARFLRGYVYFNLVRLFGEIPIVTEPLSTEELFSIPQSSEEEVYQLIIDDLEYAKEWLPDMPNIRSRPGKGTAAAFLASVYLTREEWQKCYDEAKYVIDGSASFGYSLEPDYADLFDPSIPTASSEVIFEVDFIGGDAGGNPGSLGGTNAAIDYMASITGPRGDERFGFTEGWSVAVPSLEVYNRWDPQDYRKNVSFDTVLISDGEELKYPEWGSLPRNVPRPHIAKYFRALGESGMENLGINARDSDLDYLVMRYAEILLIAAESLNELNGGSTPEAVGYLNQIRTRARRELDEDASNDRAVPASLTSALSQNAFLELILEERRLELAFEFGRWYDIKRRNLGNEVFSATGLEVRDFDPGVDYLFPKYQPDVSINPNLNQNNGY